MRGGHLDGLDTRDDDPKGSSDPQLEVVNGKVVGTQVWSVGCGRGAAFRILNKNTGRKCSFESALGGLRRGWPRCVR